MADAGPTALVWFKRDLRLRDHAPLAQAQHFERAIGLVLIEPDWLGSPECDPRHVAFLLDAVRSLQDELAALGLPLLVRVGEAVSVLEALRREHGITHLFSHEETGPGWSYARDLAVAAWSRQQGVLWREWTQTGVVRRLRSRAGWARRWAQRMDAPEAAPVRGFKGPPGLWPDPLPTWSTLGLSPPLLTPPPAGEAVAWETLHSFLGGRGRDYRRALSSPLTAESGCSRLSAHLAFGTLSMRCVHQATEAAMLGTPDRALAYGLRGFASRLRWHCHFMQKLEDQPNLEWRNLARSVDGLRAGDGVHPDGVDQERLQAWCEGRTGYPMVDACMRQLRATGWLNFRMRAMLVSFAAYHLGLHWRAPGLFLARQFLDFEPGIHWCQMQMQSGTTGINTLRIYSPAKQALDQDPLGHYRRQWLPEWGTPAYPSPLVDERQAVAAIKQQLYTLRQQPESRAEAAAIQQQHGSRTSGLPPTARRSRSARPDSTQGSLF
ncbi:FAD-binding domain-containing protein [Curvibacter sp. HBC61]|uniref:FAD-binding domain-containing protein n=1 Tax=Curvibacter cyanobacteriorum TaxID=3026422 RepID=A0ABT5MTR3_9BURK|nr:FAD-binding domain-containing protein [Curvibacter sp. HBC61]MDD0837223.1 FAD-binding domain-containing protein [Curvibacter sp. HBC61]